MTKALRFLSIVACILILIACIFLVYMPFREYHENFKGSYSNNSTDWGTYGDFIGGMLNPVFAFINILALVFLTITISRLDGKRNLANNAHQTKLLENQLKLAALKEFTNCWTKYIDRLFEAERVARNVKHANFIFDLESEGLINQYQHLFSCISAMAWNSGIHTIIGNMNAALDAGRPVDVLTHEFESIYSGRLNELQQEISNDWREIL